MVSFYILLYSGSRTGVIVTIGFLTVNLLYAFRSRVGIVEKVATIMLLPVLWTVSVIGPIVASEDMIQSLRKIDANMGARWVVGKYYWSNNKLTLFGQLLNRPVDSSATEGLSYYGIDMSQLYLLLQLGVVAFVIITILWFFLLYYEVKHNMIQELIITAFLLIMGTSDPFLYNISFKNIAFVFIGAVLYKQISKYMQYLPKCMSTLVSLMKERPESKYLIIKPIIFSEKTSSLKIYKGSMRYVIACGILAIATIIAVGLYVATPTPEYVLSDRNSGERMAHVNEKLIGRTYSAQQIRDIKKSGNIVLNYTDDTELMYIYYANEKSEIEGGFFAPNAGRVEKLRRSISVFFWSYIVIVLVLQKRKLEESYAGSDFSGWDGQKVKGTNSE